MYSKNDSALDLMRACLSPVKEAKLILDSVGDDDGPQGPADYASADLRVKAASVIQAWAGTTDDDLGEDETLADRLMMLTVGVIDSDMDGEISDAEQTIATALLGFEWDYLSMKGVSDDDCDALLNNWDNDAAIRVRDLITDTLPTDDEAAASDIDDFAFDSDSSAAVFDSVGELVLDAAYKKTLVVRQGRKVRINKRISGHVKLSAKQKIAIRKAGRKSHSAAAMVQRMKSIKIRTRAGM